MTMTVAETATVTKTATDPMNGDTTQPSPGQVRRGRRMALLLIAVGFGPMLLATVMYYTGWFNPGGHTNHGRLVQPPVPVAELYLTGADGRPLAQRFAPQLADSQWLMMVVAEQCGGDCEQLLYRVRQVNIALGKNAPRVGRAAWLGQVPAGLAGRWDREYGAMERLAGDGKGAPQWPVGVDPATAPAILLIDPLGNVMMHYGSDNSGEDLLKDLKHLLKLSRIG